MPAGPVTAVVAPCCPLRCPGLVPRKGLAAGCAAGTESDLSRLRASVLVNLATPTMQTDLLLLVNYYKSLIRGLALKRPLVAI